ncbi:hypothetical protein KW796_02765 [Candidatus Parcubacteria bacterium]|nr:hypothetical protein [Candidatus Parcubacteria bacterium]
MTHREELIAKLLWLDHDTEHPADHLMRYLKRPGPDNPEPVSVVGVEGNPGDYSDEELEKIVAFAEKANARYDEHWRSRIGANFIVFGKSLHDGKWLRKRFSWYMGPMYSDSLDEAIAFMDRGYQEAATH